MTELTEFQRAEYELMEKMRHEAAAPKLIEACQAADQCITDFIEVYKRGGQMVAMDEAVKSLRDDALRLIRQALCEAGE